MPKTAPLSIWNQHL